MSGPAEELAGEKELPFGPEEVNRARFTIYTNAAACAGWVVINAVAAEWLQKPRLLGLSGSAAAMIACWTVALADLRRGRVARGVLNYVITGLLLLLAMGIFVPEMSVLFMFATFIFLAFGLSYASTTATTAIVGLTVGVAGALLWTSQVLHLTSGVDPDLLRWVNVTGMTMALVINAVSFVGLRKTLEARGQQVALAERSIRTLREQHAADARFRDLLEGAPDAMVIADHGGNIVIVNAQTEKLFGYPREELLGKPVEMLVPARFREAYRRAYTDDPRTREMGSGMELFGKRKDGSELPIEMSLSPLEMEQGQLVSSTIRDVSERKRNEIALRSANRELEAFSYSVAHDLRAPLRGVNGFATILLEDNEGKLDAEAIDCIHRIQQSAERMAELIDALLALARVTRGEMHLEKTDLSAIAKTVIEQLRSSSPERKVEDTVEPGLTALMDPVLARTLVQNLIENAWKFTSKTETARIEVGGSEKDGAQVFFVRDNGAGFDMAYADKLFAPLKRLHPASEFPGTGIGLATVQRIAERHGGRVWAEGSLDDGATFYFLLPQSSPVAARLPVASSP